MIKKKTEFKQIEGGDIAARLAIAALDGWYIVPPIIGTGYINLIAVISREVKVTKDNIWELILADFKSEVGSVLCEEGNRIGKTLIDNEKVQQFILNTSRRYKIMEEYTRHLLILNAEEITWVKYKKEDEEDV